MDKASEQTSPNVSKYDQAFIDNLVVNESDLAGLSFQSVASWDSVGHMALMAAIEDAFDITLEMDDVLDFSSYEVGKELLIKYGVEI